MEEAMSLKSFDKFCEKMIMGEPSSQKPIFDERQNVMRSQLITEALIIYAALSSLNTMLMELGLKWCAGFFAPMVLFAALCVLWWLIRCSVKGALFGVNGTSYAKVNGSVWCVMGLMYALITLFGDDGFVGFLFYGMVSKDVSSYGMVSEDILLAAAFIIMFACGVYMLVAAGREDKRRKNDE